MAIELSKRGSLSGLTHIEDEDALSGPKGKVVCTLDVGVPKETPRWSLAGKSVIAYGSHLSDHAVGTWHFLDLDQHLIGSGTPCLVTIR